MAEHNGPPDEPGERTAPPGHSRAAHAAHGFCSKCSGRELWEELAAWRADYNTRHGHGAPDVQLHPSPEARRG